MFNDFWAWFYVKFVEILSTLMACTARGCTRAHYYCAPMFALGNLDMIWLLDCIHNSVMYKAHSLWSSTTKRSKLVFWPSVLSCQFNHLIYSNHFEKSLKCLNFQRICVSNIKVTYYISHSWFYIVLCLHMLLYNTSKIICLMPV